MLFTTPIPEGIHNSEISDDILSVKASPSTPCHQENIPKPPSLCATLGNHTHVLLDRSPLVQLFYGIKPFRDWQFIFSLARQTQRWTQVICQFLFKLQSDNTVDHKPTTTFSFPEKLLLRKTLLAMRGGSKPNSAHREQQHIKHPTSGTALP